MERGRGGDPLEALDFLPLAITQAAAFINEHDITLADYLELLQAGDSDTKNYWRQTISTRGETLKSVTPSFKRGGFLSTRYEGRRRELQRCYLLWLF
jgi:hypothetical protein